jgi:hypothetical protein
LLLFKKIKIKKENSEGVTAGVGARPPPKATRGGARPPPGLGLTAQPVAIPSLFSIILFYFKKIIFKFYLFIYLYMFFEH